MAQDTQVAQAAKDLQGFRYLAQLHPLLQRLHDNGLDKVGNRRLFFDQYVALLLLYFFNPILTSLNALQQATRLEKIQKLIGGGPSTEKCAASYSGGAFSWCQRGWRGSKSQKKDVPEAELRVREHHQDAEEPVRT
jgi:hypothetical protein